MSTQEAAIDSLFERFEGLSGIVERIAEIDVLWGIGGSAALFVSGHKRFPHDVDIILTTEGHDRLDALFRIRSERVETPAEEARKSLPGADGSVSFLSDYTIKVGDRRYLYELTPEMIKRRDSRFGPVHVLRPEVVVIAKALLQRPGEHKQDLQDVLEVAKARPLDSAYVSELARRLGASDIVKKVLKLVA
ncbi:MAG: hypothetical protein Q8Q11_01175 [bacterium]|nr:hypothetical protein [bacterium]MDZ4248101.1 hypothetical protein [Patescibacteria group bacterium]